MTPTSLLSLAADITAATADHADLTIRDLGNRIATDLSALSACLERERRREEVERVQVPDAEGGVPVNGFGG